MSHQKLGHYSRKEIFSLDDGVYRIERNLYLRVRAGGKYRNFFYRYSDERGIPRDVAFGSARKVPMYEIKQKYHF